MEKKRTNSGPPRKPAVKHSIYTMDIPPRTSQALLTGGPVRDILVAEEVCMTRCDPDQADMLLDSVWYRFATADEA